MDPKGFYRKKAHIDFVLSTCFWKNSMKLVKITKLTSMLFYRGYLDIFDI